MAKSKSMNTATAKYPSSIKQTNKNVGVVKNGECDIQSRK